MEKGKSKRKKSEKPSKQKELLSYFKKAIGDVKYSTDEKRVYFEELYNLSIQAQWKHLPPWERVKFFRRWFIAISEEYTKGYIKFEAIKKQHFSQKRTINPSELVTEHPWLNDNEEAYRLCVSASAVFDLSLGKLLRDGSLVLYWLYPLYYDKSSRFPLSFPMPPVLHTSIEDALEGKRELEKWEKCGRTKKMMEAIKCFLIDVKYPAKVILEEIAKEVKEQQAQYFSKYPKDKSQFVKETVDGRTDTYPFDEWERYLKVYMLKQQGKSRTELAREFFPASRQIAKAIDSRMMNFKRQISTYSQKAKKLSKNAVTGNFPGKY